jgi:hypothetical protein
VDAAATATLLFDLLHGAADAIASGMSQERIRQAAVRIVHRALEPRGDSGAAGDRAPAP